MASFCDTCAFREMCEHKGILLVSSLPSEYSLETLAEAVRYNEFVYTRMLPSLGEHILELGTGIGNLTPLFLREGRRVKAIDIDPALLDVHRARVPPSENLSVECLSIQALASRDETEHYDSIVSSNVLEHIPDGEIEEVVDAMYRLLKPGGTAIHWVPAFQSIFGSLDRSFKHMRRYSKKSGRVLFESHGFTVDSCSYWNMPGFFGWWLYGTIVKAKAIPRSSALTFDRFVVPVLKVLEPRLWRPFGQSLLIVARKPS